MVTTAIIVWKKMNKGGPSFLVISWEEQYEDSIHYVRLGATFMIAYMQAQLFLYVVM